MDKVTGRVVFHVRDVYQFVVDYTATLDNDGSLYEIDDDTVDATVDIYKANIYSDYVYGLEQAVIRDLKEKNV